MPVATPEDVGSRVGRPLTEDETQQATSLLQDVEARILARIPGALERADRDQTFKQNLIAVECSVTMRAGRFGKDVQFEAPSDRQVLYDPETMQSGPGYLSIRIKEWRALGIPGIQIRAVTPLPRFPGHHHGF